MIEQLRYLSKGYKRISDVKLPRIQERKGTNKRKNEKGEIVTYVSCSWTVTLPKQLFKAHGFAVGDNIEFIFVDGDIAIRKKVEDVKNV